MSEKKRIGIIFSQKELDLIKLYLEKKRDLSIICHKWEYHITRPLDYLVNDYEAMSSALSWIKKDEEYFQNSKEPINYALCTACQEGAIEIVELLLENGADPNFHFERNKFLFQSIKSSPLIKLALRFVRERKMKECEKIYKLMVEYNLKLSTNDYSHKKAMKIFKYAKIKSHFLQ